MAYLVAWSEARPMAHNETETKKDQRIEDLLDEVFAAVFKRLLIDKGKPRSDTRKPRSDKGKKRGPYKKTAIPLTHFHVCPDCATCVEGTESDTRASLARQIGGTWNEDEGSITCSCGWFMDCVWYRGEELVGNGWDGVKHG